MNVIMNDKGGFIEIQGTAEGEAFSDEHMMGMLAVARKGIAEIMEAQRAALSDK
jgi:ribonuclease PH